MANRHVFLEPWRRGMYIDTEDFIQPLDWRYTIEKWMYGASMILGALAFSFTVFRLCRTDRKKLILAARLFSYKLSLTAADVIILFLYAPCQFIWISTFWWYAGDGMCRMFKFMAAFGFHLTANMQVLVAFDRLFITATMRTCRLSRKEPYNTSACLLVAWGMALLCSCPQLIVFGTSSPGDGKEQCVSIWLQRRMDHMEQLEYLRDYEKHLELRVNTSSEIYFPNGTLRHWVDKPNFTEETILEEATRLMYFEQAYNVVHLTTICVLPYLLELFCYTLILYLLKGAQHGHFPSLSEALRSKFCCGPKTDHNDNEQRLPIDRSVSITSMDFTAWLRKVRSPQRTQSISEVPLPRASTTSVLLTPRDNRDRSASCSQLNARQTSETELQQIDEASGNDEHSSCAAACLPKTNKLPTSGQGMASSVPWMTTVSYARRKARLKAFWMLSVNLLLWSPYCLVGVMNAVTIFPEFANFQFAAALVAFNSISNLLL